MADLRGAISNSQTTIQIDDTTDFPVDGGVVQIESEEIRYTRATDKAILGCTRAFNGTSAATHADKKHVTLLSDEANVPFNPVELSGDGAPTDNLTGVGFATSGARYTNLANGTMYLNSSDELTPTWVLLQAGSDDGITQLTGDVTAGPGSGSQAATIGTGKVTPAKISTVATDDFIFPNEIVIQGQSGGGSAILDFFDKTTGNYRIIANIGSAALQFYAAGQNPLVLQNNNTTVNGVLKVPTGPASVGTASPHASSILDLESTTLGFLPPQMTAAQRDAISSPKEGLMVYVTDLFQLWQYQNGVWAAVGGSTSAAGSDTQVQFNDGGTAFGGNSKLTFNKTTGDLTLGNNQKLVLGDSSTAFLKYNSSATEYQLGQPVTLGSTYLTTTGDFVLAANNGGTELPNIQLLAAGGSQISLDTGKVFDINNPAGHIYLAGAGFGHLNTGLKVGNNQTLDASSLLEMESTTKGFLPPRMTNTQRDAIASPAEGLTIYSTSDHALEFYNGTTWKVVATV